MGIKKIIPKRLKSFYWKIKEKFMGKYGSELYFWKCRLKIDKGTFINSHYKSIMLAMAEETDDSFMKGKIVADFGCGPRGSLIWAKSAFIRIGIDVLADIYSENFKDNIISHNMIYVKSTEHVIPLPSQSVDILFTLNAIDHVDNFEEMCKEILRIIKIGGLFIGSFNLEEPQSTCEPQRLNESIIKDKLLKHLDIISYRITKKGPLGNYYKPFFDNSLSYEKGQEGYLWVKARKTTL